MRASFNYLAVVALLGACVSSTAAPPPHCISTWHPVWTADSSVALCIPPDFVSAGPNAWGRRKANGAFADLLSVQLLSWPQDSTTLSGWPPHLASGPNCLADCATADSVTVHRDTVAGVQVSTEVGLVSGGEPGFRRHPFLVRGWTLTNTSRGFAQGWTTNPATLDTLRDILKTVRSLTERIKQPPN